MENFKGESAQEGNGATPCAVAGNCLPAWQQVIRNTCKLAISANT
jgi:hypothetical protein